MNSPPIVLTDAPTADELGAIRRPLDQFNLDACGIADQRPLALLVRNPMTHEVVGGLNGRTSRGILFIDVFFLPESMRGNGLGSRLLRMAEEEGLRRGCLTGILYTNNFQAPGFYKKHGWREFGRFPSIPPGTSRIFLTKELT
ncbi:GNAT family N-acetyltransferase [Dyella nitratireducens]|uniref:N-acetyltransferase n=1 Tax=Dyella nitratireducens TaxID=1849580 RepID=A0ABQ1FRK5_9GAMM|nr:GNAT family N-acetyltransferase [Dyella nitratireducens]GGA27050.1 N-acetyltransferase [Dyella nitratireducens]GLQ43470.1 N-acetyltransferase [Dyella nitratireducens]